MKYKTKGNASPHGKPRVYFCCHGEDFDPYFEGISDEILSKQNCAVWYRENGEARDRDFEDALKRMQLFVFPVTAKLLSAQNEALYADFQIAVENHIPVLPLLQESGLEELFNQKYGEIHCWDRTGEGASAADYREKLGKYLSSVLIGDELAEKIRAAFDAYIFLSYRKKDRKYAQELMRLIHEIESCRDFAIWYDEFLTPGENFNDSIQEAIRKSDLFLLAVTPNLVCETNYVLTEEYPMAQREGKRILPAELVPTERNQLQKLYPGIPTPVDAYDPEKLLGMLQEATELLALSPRAYSAEHDFYIGLAYLGGVDLEVDHARALALIQGAADADLPEAMAQLVSMYTHGLGVECSRDRAQQWSKRLGQFYFEQCFDTSGTLCAKEKLHALFSHRQEESWADAIRYFLLAADGNLDRDAFHAFFRQLLELGISEYTLLFDACEEMRHYKEAAQCLLIEDILTKSVDGTYPAYGPLFWYIPEYALYEPLLLVAARLKSAKALALTRDVIVMFKQVYTAREVTDRIDPEMLFLSVCTELSGVRRALCELFYTGTTEYLGGDAIYPRCFNVGEAIALQDHHCGLFGRMAQPFEDELGLYSHTMYPELNGEYIGIVSAPYDTEKIEQTLAQKHCGKVRGLFLSATEDQRLTYITFMRKSVQILYLPENVTEFGKDAFLHMDLRQGHYTSSNGTFYYDRMYTEGPHVILPEGLNVIPNRFFWESSLRSVYIPESVEMICDNAFHGCKQLQEITIPPSVCIIGEGAFSACGSLREVFIPGTVKKLGVPIYPVTAGGLHFFKFGVFERCEKLRKVHIAEGVETVGEQAFSQCTALEKIQLPNTVLEIARLAFQKCEKLREFTFPEGITEVAYSLFNGCTDLRRVKLSDSIRDIRDKAFRNCQSLEEINIGPMVTLIRSHAFYGCTALGSVRIPGSVNAIYSRVFSGCTGLTSVTLSEGIEHIGAEVFKDCTSLESLDIPNSVETLGMGVLEGCTKLQRATLPDGLEMIPNNTFRKCCELTDVKLPASARSIGRAAFYECRRLCQPTLPDSLAVIGQEAFAVCHHLEELRLPAGLSRIEDEAFRLCFLRKLVIPDRINHIAEAAFFGCALRELSVPGHIDITGLKLSSQTRVEVRPNRLERNYVFPPEISAIEDSAFENNGYLESVVIPETVQKVGNNAFTGCGSLTEVYIADGVELESGVFRKCPALRKVRLPAGLSRIPDSLFSHCSALEELQLPPSVREIHRNSFYQCDSLKRVLLPSRLEKLGGYAFKRCKLTSVDIPQGITTVEEGAFAECGDLRVVNLAESVEVIDHGAFMKCSALESVTVTDRVTRLGRKDVDHPMFRWDSFYHGVFQECVNLTAVTLGASLQMIGDHTFEGCGRLKQIVLPDGLEYLGCYGFKKCTSLQEIVIPDSVPSLFGTFDHCHALTRVTLPEGLWRIGAYVFRSCEALSDIKLPNRVTEIGTSAFEGCRGLTRIRLPDSLEILGGSAFQDCSQLTEIHIPVNVKEIGSHAFYGCDALKAITVSYNFRNSIEELFGQIDPEIITFV